jgi:hypothetical protein
MKREERQLGHFPTSRPVMANAVSPALERYSPYR